MLVDGEIDSVNVLTAVVVAALGLYFGWSALGALRSGEITLYVRYNRDRHFSRRVNPAAYWIVVSLYLMFGAVAAAGIVMRIVMR